uniref:Cilia- and flagella-associated protein 43 n=1 Tax=Coturnix japonica TaxID=93934 RepID=A0A8C2U9E8_COTJA
MTARNPPQRDHQGASESSDWVQGFPNKNFGFINNQTVCYPCGNYILFFNTETKKTTALHCQTGQVGAFAVNPKYGVLAFSDRKLNPVIYIYSFPELNKLSELKGHVQLDYSLLAFSFLGPYLASYSSFPDFVLSLWNWKENILLCSESQPGVTATSISFNPMNWQQLCFVTETSVTIWCIERNHDEHCFIRNPVKLPDGKGSLDHHKNLFFPYSCDENPYHGPVMPVSAIAGLVGDEAETFVPRTDIKPSLRPTAHCWNTDSDIYLGCKEGYILEVDTMKYTASIIQQKPLPGKRQLFLPLRTNVDLYFSAQEGILYFYDISDLQYEMKICADISEPISTLVFSPDYTVLLIVTDQATAMACCPSSSSVAVGTGRGQIYFIDITKAEAPRVVHRISLSKFPVLSLHYDQSGQFLIVTAMEGYIFILDARPSKLFQVLGYVGNTCNNIDHIMFSQFVYVNDQGMLNSSAIEKKQYDLQYPLSSAVRLKDNIVYGYCTCAPFICRYNLSEQVNPPKVEILAQNYCHSYEGGGIRSIVFSLDGKFILVNGENDGALVCLKWKYIIREETERFGDQKKDLQMGIEKLHKTIQKMMHENEQVPDIEKLEQHEFNLDTEEQEKAQAEAEQEVARKIEMEILANCYLQDIIRHECWDSMCVKGRAVKCFHIDCEVKNYPLKKRDEEELRTLEKVLSLRKIETTNLKVQKNVPETKPKTVLFKEEEWTEEVMVDDTASCRLAGSLSSQYGADTSILYHQLDLHSREQKVNQIVLLKDIIYKVQTAFNKEFDVVAQQKEQEIARIKERNVRVREILAQLELQVEVWEPGLTGEEEPEQALTVHDSEIKAEKYLTPEEREKAELLLRLEMERQLASLDNERQRALNDMMGGVLEVKQEDILKMDIPPPSFLSKPEDEWNDHEKKIFRKYEEEVKELNEQKEKYRTQLRNELEELEASIQEIAQNFDKSVCKLFERKVDLEKVIYQEELKIVNLIYSLLLDEELDSREAGLHHFLVKKQKEKNLEYSFRKEFADVPANLLDELSELYKCRPDCSVSAEDFKDALTRLMRAMDELDNPEHMPNGLDPSIWEKFCLARRNKLESEQQVKWMAQILEEIEFFLRRRKGDDMEMTSKVERIYQELTWLREEKIKLQLNLTFQFLLKQGQVELESNGIPDYADAIFIKRNVVEELNCDIMEQVEKKIASMVEYKESSKGIFKLKWEHKKMSMQIEDLNQKAQDIVALPITKDRQLLSYELMYLFYLFGNAQLHKKTMRKHQKKIKELEKCISLKEQANYELSIKLKEMLVSVSERRHLSQHINERIAKRRYQEILKQKHLRSLIGKQEEHVEILQAKAERLRSKTFPIL